MHGGEATYTNFIVFGLTRSGLEPTIFRIPFEGSTDVVELKLALSIQFTY